MTNLTSGVLFSPADALLSHAIAETLRVVPGARAERFAALVAAIELSVMEQIPERPWTATRFLGTDGSHIFRGGVGHSLVIDSAGRMWRARSYEDFDTTYRLAEDTCEIASLTPKYWQMRELLPRQDSVRTR